MDTYLFLIYIDRYSAAHAFFFSTVFFFFTTVGWKIKYKKYIGFLKYRTQDTFWDSLSPADAPH